MTSEEMPVEVGSSWWAHQGGRRIKVTVIEAVEGRGRRRFRVRNEETGTKLPGRFSRSFLKAPWAEPPSVPSPRKTAPTQPPLYRGPAGHCCGDMRGQDE